MFHERLVLLSKLIIAQSRYTSNKIDFTTLSGKYLLWQTTKLLNVDSGTHTLCEFTIQKLINYKSYVF